MNSLKLHEGAMVNVAVHGLLGSPPESPGFGFTTETTGLPAVVNIGAGTTTSSAVQKFSGGPFPQPWLSRKATTLNGFPLKVTVVLGRSPFP